MTVRTARKGRNAGGQFYGCSNYPHCKETLPFDGVSIPDNVPSNGAVSTNVVPQRIHATPVNDHTQAILFECIALPREAILAAVYNELDTSIARSFSQWQLDFPLTSPTRGPSFGIWFSVVEKILKRGSLTTISPGLEGIIRQIVQDAGSYSELEWFQAVRSVASGPRPASDWEGGFDSEEERLFYSTVFPRLSGVDPRGWLLRQVPLDNIAGNKEGDLSHRRVDFVFAHPQGRPIVIEIDGAQHSSMQKDDSERDDDLAKAGFTVIRIPAEEVRDGRGPKLDELGGLLPNIPPSADQSSVVRFLKLVRRAQQIQLALWQAMMMGVIAVDGHPARFRVDISLGDGFDRGIETNFRDAVLDDLNSLITDVAALYRETDTAVVFEGNPEADIHIAFPGTSVHLNVTNAIVKDTYLPVTIATEFSSHSSADIEIVDHSICKRLLKRFFGFDDFLEGQFEAAERCLVGKDTIVLLPTGAGKSVAYQFAALLRPGLGIVIDPILSLIEDQIENLRKFGIDRICQITSKLELQDREAILVHLAQGEYLFCFVAPERFQSESFRNSLRALTTNIAVSSITIDEAHCVSEWGHDFRPAYLNLARISRKYCACRGKSPPLMALTGTASRAVLKDVQRELQIDDYDAIITPKSFDRPELRFDIISCSSSEKIYRLQGLLNGLPSKYGTSKASFFEPQGMRTFSGLIFCPHVDGDFGVFKVGTELAQMLGTQVPSYSGREPKGMKADAWKTRKDKVASDFKRNHFALMTCTKAFGMGIDKPNIRYTIHYALPNSIESFYQEAGRAGRDRNDAHCIIAFSNDNPDRTRRLLNPSTAVEAVNDEVNNHQGVPGDDITRALWFHSNSFQGVNADYEQVQAVLEELGDVTSPRTVDIYYTPDSKKDRKANKNTGPVRNKLHREKAIHRLLTIGVVSDYTVDYSAHKFGVTLSGCDNDVITEHMYRYVAAYQRGQAKVIRDRIENQKNSDRKYFIQLVSRELIRFVYEIIERSRRQALFEMLSLCEQCADEEAIRKRLLAYLGTSAFSEQIDILLSSPNGGLDEALVLIENIRSALDAGQIRGETGRALESYPDHAGLRLLRAVSEVMTSDPGDDVISSNMEACVRFAVSKYGVELSTVLDRVALAIRVAAEARANVAIPMLQGILNATDEKRAAARQLVSNLPAGMTSTACAALVTLANERLAAFLKE